MYVSIRSLIYEYAGLTVSHIKRQHMDVTTWAPVNLWKLCLGHEPISYSQITHAIYFHLYLNSSTHQIFVIIIITSKTERMQKEPFLSFGLNLPRWLCDLLARWEELWCRYHWIYQLLNCPHVWKTASHWGTVKVQFLEQLNPVTTSAYPTWLAFKWLHHWDCIPVGICSAPVASQCERWICSWWNDLGLSRFRRIPGTQPLGACLNTHAWFWR